MLDAVGAVSGLRFSTSVNGDLAATWQMHLNSRTDHRALAPGRTVRIPIGATRAWQGILGNPRRGDVWEFTATGWQALGQNYGSIAPTNGNALELDDVVDDAIGRGLPWTRPAALPTVPNGSEPSGYTRVVDVLNAVCDAKGKVWTVDRDGQLTAADRPSTVAYLLQANDTAGGRTVRGFVTDVHVTYIDWNSYAQTTILRSVTSRPYGRFEDVLDLTDKGPISAAHAQDHGDNWLAKRGPRLRFTSAFSITPGQLLSPGGVPVDLATVQASDGTVRVMLTDPDSAAGELALGPVEVPVGETEYDVDSDTLTLTPLDHTPTGLQTVFS